MARNGISINYEFCTGCHTCEVSCKMEHKIPEGQWGIKLAEVGPWEFDGGKWQLDYVPVLTAQCDLCSERVAIGKKPACVHNCQSAVMKFGPVNELLKEIEEEEQKFGHESKTVIFIPKTGK